MDWYYADGDQQKGPVSDEAIGELVAAGVVGDTTLVWRDGFAGWRRYGDVSAESQIASPPAPDAAWCNECGRQVTASDLVAIGGRRVCANCKAPVLQRIREGAATVSGRTYVGFWLRFAAYMIDYVLLGIVNLFITIAFIGTAVLVGDPSATLAGFIATYLLSITVAVVYEGWFLVHKGATLGKLAVGVRVIRDSGRPITWGLAIGRYFAKMVSGLILGFGFLMIAWDEEKRGLHDRICDTRVIKV